MKKYTFLYLAFFVLAISCLISSCDDEEPNNELPAGATFIEPSQQRTTGNVDEGWDFLRYGNYIGAGIPINIFKNFFPDDNENVLNRTGENATIPPNFNAFDVNGVSVVGGLTCMHCHGAKLNGAFIVGLGNSFTDFTADFSFLYNVLDGMVSNEYGMNSPEWNAYYPLSRGAKAAAPYMQAPFRGVNTAMMLDVAAVAHRNPSDLTWSDTPIFTINPNGIATDVPPLWNLRKKNGLYYNGMGTGDFTKHIMQAIVVAISDSTEARSINDYFDDVMAWIKTIEPPTYPETIDETLANQGQSIYEANCSQCHGTYGDNPTYPNLLLDWNYVKTDSLYAQYLFEAETAADWFNQSWLANSFMEAKAKPHKGYIAPPLDGIWATAPYLHNGSVPTLDDLLNSSQRPTYWKRTFDESDLDFTKMGWNYTAENQGGSTDIYDTTIPGYGNMGHTYGDYLTSDERKALIEYLKIL